MNIVVKGFVKELGGFVSFYFGIGDIIFIGKRKEDMFIVFCRVKEFGGGMVIVEKNEVLYEIVLLLFGIMFNLKMRELI